MVRYILIYILSFTLSFSLELSSKEFGEKIRVGKLKEKEYILVNNSKIKKEYFLSATDKNVTIKPKGFRLNPFEQRKIRIRVKATEKGRKDYYLEIKEIIREKKENTVNINKLFRIRQDYTGI